MQAISTNCQGVLLQKAELIISLCDPEKGSKAIRNDEAGERCSYSLIILFSCFFVYDTGKQKLLVEFLIMNVNVLIIPRFCSPVKLYVSYTYDEYLGKLRG